MAAGTSTAPPAGQGQGAAPPEGQAGGAGVDARLGKLEATQERQGELLERIAAAVTGNGGAGAPAGGAQQPAGADLVQQVREEIKAADERRRQQEGEEEWRNGVNEVIEKVKAENAPREPETGARAVIRRALFGKPELWAGWRRPTFATIPRGGCPGSASAAPGPECW